MERESKVFILRTHFKQGNNCHVHLVIFSNLNFSIAKKTKNNPSLFRCFKWHYLKNVTPSNTGFIYGIVGVVLLFVWLLLSSSISTSVIIFFLLCIYFQVFPFFTSFLIFFCVSFFLTFICVYRLWKVPFFPFILNDFSV